MAISKKLNKLINQLAKKDVENYQNDFLKTWQKSTEEIEATLLTTQILKEMYLNNISPKIFNSGLAVSQFKDKSTRTRFSFSSAANLLGLEIQSIDESSSQISHGETSRETANMISFMTEVIGIRDDIFLGRGNLYMKKVAQFVDKGFQEGALPQRPSVINLQCDEDHPTQSLSDLSHLKNYFHSLENLKGKKLAMSWAYSPSYGKPLSVPQGVINLMVRFGMKVFLAYPQGYNLIPELEKMAQSNAVLSGGSFTKVNSMEEAFDQADIVYPKSWAPYKIMVKRTNLLEEKKEKELENLKKECLLNNAKYKKWECTEEKMRLTKKGKALYMHCLPADISGVSCKKGEVEKNVFNRYRKETYQQASYKPYVIAAMIILTKFSQPALLFKKLLKRNSYRKFE